MIVNCSVCGSEMEIDTASGAPYVTEENGDVHHVHDCAAAESDGE